MERRQKVSIENPGSVRPYRSRRKAFDPIDPKGRVSLAGVLIALIALGLGYFTYQKSSKTKKEAVPPVQESSVPTTVPTVTAAPEKGVVQRTVKRGPNVPKPSAAMVLVPAGEFMMGTLHGSGFGNDQQHKVYLNAYYMDPYPVTFEEYDRYCDATGAKKPSDNGWGRGRRPVINVTWEDADQYAHWAKKRLPTEAEYEKALRGGTQTEFFFGDTSDPVTDYAWIGKNSGKMTHPVGGKKPNPIGLYDMVGNILEWCSDWYDQKYYAASPGKNPTGAFSSATRVLRGGGWDEDPRFCTSTLRHYGYPYLRNNSVGFRCARTP